MKLKVYGGLIHMGSRGQLRTIVAARSQKAAAKYLHHTLHEQRTWWCETGNETELETALSNEGQVFMATSTHSSAGYEPVYWNGGWWKTRDCAGISPAGTNHGSTMQNFITTTGNIQKEVK